MKKLWMIVGMMLATAMGPVWVADDATPGKADPKPAQAQATAPEEMILRSPIIAESTAYSAHPCLSAEAGGQVREKAMKLLGRNGFAVIRNAAEEKVFLERLKQAGVEVQWIKAQPIKGEWTPDYSNGLKVVCWRDILSADTLKINGAVQVSGSDTPRLDLQFLNGEADKNIQTWKALGVWIPRTARLEVPGQGKDEIWTADDKGRDVADGLQAWLEVKQTAIKPGDDITLTMSLRNARPAGGDPITVWDNKYSNGYRADFYLVVTPDGQSRVLRRAVQGAWDKNIPTPISIQSGKSWTLAGFANDAIAKSLKSLGLDTTQSGIYTITGYYEAEGGQGGVGEKNCLFWGGQIATPPVEVCVGDRDAAAPAAAATIAWGVAANEVQAGLVPLGGVKGGGWGEEQNLFFCPKCARQPRKHCMDPSVAAAKRVCAVCVAPKPWSAAFVAGEPLRLEVHLKNTGKERCSLYDARYGEHWRFTFTPIGGGIKWEAQLNMPKARRSVESLRESMIELAAGMQNAVVFDLGDGRVNFADSERRAPSVKTLPPGKYAVTASYSYATDPGVKTAHWQGSISTGPVEIEIKPDDATARFLEAAKYAGFAAVAEVKTLPQVGDNAKPAQLGIEWKDLLYAPEAPRQAMAGVKALAVPTLKPGVADAKAAAELKIGDRILVVVDERTVHFRVRSDAGRALLTPWTEGAQLVPWTQSRQDALQAALAPGWQFGCCPWCRQQRGNWENRAEYEAMQAKREAAGKGEAVPKTQGVCQACNKPTALLANKKLCPACAAQRGECWACERAVGPATRDVIFRLWAYDPTVPWAASPPNPCRIQAGAVFLPLWVEVQNEKGATPEFMTPGGGKRFDRCNTLFYLVEGPGLSSPTAAFRCELARTMAPSALQQGSAVGPVELIAGTLLASPGTYTVRAVAGRLVSNPVTVIVEPETAAQGKSMQEAEAKAQIERGQQIDREREMKERAIRERGQ